MLYENSHNKMAPTTARSISNPRQPAMGRPVQNTLPKTGVASPKPVTKSTTPVTGWPSVTKQTPRQAVGTAVKTMPVKNAVSVAGAATKSRVPVTGWPSASKHSSMQTGNRLTQNAGFIPGRSITTKKPLSNAANSVSFKRPLQAPPISTPIKPTLRRPSAGTAYTMQTRGYQATQSMSRPTQNWGGNRLIAAPMKKAAFNKYGVPYRYTAAGGSTVPQTFVNRGGRNYVPGGAVNSGIYYRGNNRPPATQIAVPTQAGTMGGAIQYQRNRQPGAYQQPPCSCKSCNGHAQTSIPSLNEPSNFPENTGNYGGNVTEQQPPVPAKPIGICHTCGKTGKGCTTIARFTFNSFQLKNRHKAQLKELAKNILNKKVNVIIATGHTDSSGTEDYNQDLGAKRAATVISELRKQLSLLKPNAQRALLWRTDSKGETKPVAANNAANNRRVEVCLRRTKL